MKTVITIAAVASIALLGACGKKDAATTTTTTTTDAAAPAATDSSMTATTTVDAAADAMKTKADGVVDAAQHPHRAARISDSGPAVFRGAWHH